MIFGCDIIISRFSLPVLRGENSFTRRLWPGFIDNAANQIVWMNDDATARKVNGGYTLEIFRYFHRGINTVLWSEK